MEQQATSSIISDSPPRPTASPPGPQCFRPPPYRRTQPPPGIRALLNNTPPPGVTPAKKKEDPGQPAACLVTGGCTRRRRGGGSRSPILSPHKLADQKAASQPAYPPAVRNHLKISGEMSPENPQSIHLKGPAYSKSPFPQK